MTVRRYFIRAEKDVRKGFTYSVLKLTTILWKDKNGSVKSINKKDEIYDRIYTSYVATMKSMHTIAVTARFKIWLILKLAAMH